jgi:archaellum biogenesis ATPase FlaH
MIEKVILANLALNEEFARKVVPFLKLEYFHDSVDRAVFDVIDSYSKKYNKFPSKEALAIELSRRDNLSEDIFKSCTEFVEGMELADTDFDWLVDQSEKFCQDKAIYNAIMKSIQVIDDKTGKLSKGSIPALLSDALSVSFDTHIGHDFIADAPARYDFYHTKEVKIPFDLDLFNRITKGGLSRKTLNIILAGTGVGKSLCMCHMAANNLTDGKNVLYITLEMAEERIAERIDANLLDTPLDELELLPRETYDSKMERLRTKCKGKLIIKEYPTSQASSSNFRHLIQELKIKKNFVPDIIYIDYLNICASARIKHGANVNSYTYIKAIAEELRGLAVENDVPIVSATQTTRSGYTSSDVGLEDTSESFGLPATADFMFAVIRTEELDELNQVLVKQLKNRYSDVGSNRRFVIGIDRSKMRLYDCEQSAQDDILDGPVMDKTEFGKRLTDAGGQKFNKSMFEDFK